ncbi:MAG: EAL domain-containing protein [Chloroflexi bacterium]|nr:EAL domain-containing protein [Chloroflexota bacterium]
MSLVPQSLWTVRKIDRSFVINCNNNLSKTGSEDVVKLITNLSHTLNMRVVAEGVETKAQMEFLRTIGCEEGQGYLFSKPLPPNELENLIDSNLILSELIGVEDLVGESVGKNPPPPKALIFSTM